MFPVDPSWPQAYLQVAVSILIFGVGLPSMVLQAIVPGDIREVVHRHYKLLRWGYLFYIPLMMLVVMIFLWIIHPGDTTQLTFSAGFGTRFNFDSWDEVIITISMFGLLFFWFLQVLYRRDRLLIYLELISNLRIWFNKIPEGQVLDDIRYLGEQGKSRGYKIRILEIFERLAQKIQAHKRYHGNGLEDIIQAIEFTLQKDIEAESFTKGILTLKHVLENEPKSKDDSSTDTGAILRALQRLGSVAITMDNERPARKILETVESVSRSPNGAFSEAALALYVLGVAALEHGRFLVAVEALSKLEAMTCRKEPVDVAKSSAYLGLIAHFWAGDGAARQCALSSLKRVKFSPSRLKCLRGAQETHYNSTRFNTADVLSKMITAL